MSGRKPRRHDCGEHGWLTAGEIAERAGLSYSAINDRLRRGVKGAALLAPATPHVRRRGTAVTAWTDKGMHTCGSITIAAALRIVRLWPDRPPSVAQLRETFGVSRATAYRWRAAWIDELGLAA